MAMHKSLQPGLILSTDYDAQYSEINHQNGEPRYTIRFNALFVLNRRERTSGGVIPDKQIPFCQKLGIRLERYANATVAVGCRSTTYLTVRNDTPYPSALQEREAAEYLERILAEGSLSFADIVLYRDDTIQQFSKKKLGNQDFLFTVKPPIEEYFYKETYSVSQ